MIPGQAKIHLVGTVAEGSLVDIRLHNFSRVEVKGEDSSSIIVDSSWMLLYRSKARHFLLILNFLFRCVRR